jgi:hypothetical protein
LLQTTAAPGGTTVVAEGGTTMVCLGGDELLKLRHPESASGKSKATIAILIGRTSVGENDLPGLIASPRFSSPPPRSFRA